MFEKDFVAEPRLSVRYTPIPELTINAAVGLVGQPPPAEDLSAVFGIPTLSAATGVHTLLGI